MKALIFSLIRWVYWYPFCRLIQSIPISLTYKLSSLFVPIYYFFSQAKRKKIFQGLVSMHGSMIPRKKLEMIVYKTFDNGIKAAMEHLVYPQFDAEFCKKNIEYKGLKNLNEALRAGRGVVLLHGHIGNPHMIMPSIGSQGYKLNQLASRNPPETVHGFLCGLVNRIRYKCYEKALFLKEKFPVNFIYIDKLLSAPFIVLKRNEVLAMALDGREGSKSINVRFLNHNASFYTGVMRLILLTNPVVLPTFHIRNKNNKHVIIINSALEIEKTENKVEDIRRNMEKFVRILERYVYQYPYLYAEAFALNEPFLEYQNDSSL